MNNPSFIIAAIVCALLAVAVVVMRTVRRKLNGSAESTAAPAPIITDEEMQAYDRAVMESQTWNEVP